MGTLIQFFKDSWSEIRKVSWPKTDELIKHTVNVVVFVLIFSAIATLVDYGMKSIYSALPASNSLPTTQNTTPILPTDVQTTATGEGTSNVEITPTTTPTTTPSN
ncbi:MAG: preprotein translocase subunit SecE [Candidatus Gracilibacteria bacterium]